ncbi:Regenerating islet-derived protein 4 [Aphelenchoides avenae]|nr:Regenerating islet-derived protein 4 [Aphelenchus avenae]
MTLLGFILHRLLTASALVSALHVGLASSQGFCPEGWTYAEKTHVCYRAVFEPKTWEGALKACQRWNATLPIIHDVDTDAALREFAIKYVDAEGFHIGLRRNASSGGWQWIDGSRPLAPRGMQFVAALPHLRGSCVGLFSDDVR